MFSSFRALELLEMFKMTNKSNEKHLTYVYSTGGVFIPTYDKKKLTKTPRLEKSVKIGHQQTIGI